MRNCLLCGDMICGCKFHRQPQALATLYGLCRSCSVPLGRRLGEHLKSEGDSLVKQARGNQFHLWRVKQELARLQSEVKA